MYDGAIKLAPGNPVYHMEKAIALHKSERHQEALREIEIAEGLNSDLVLLHFEKGTILLDLKKNQEAIEEFDKGIETDPTNVNSEVLNHIMKTEFVDVYDESLEITGITERETAHRFGSLHKTAQWWLIDSDSVYFQIRSKNIAFPGLLDATVGGHITAGESAEEALLREIEEEVGIRLRTSELTFVGSVSIPLSNSSIAS